MRLHTTVSPVPVPSTSPVLELTCLSPASMYTTFSAHRPVVGGWLLSSSMLQNSSGQAHGVVPVLALHAAVVFGLLDQQLSDEFAARSRSSSTLSILSAALRWPRLCDG
eukprot:CAMPEP_0179037278 /NCGR_PEP_ID=MMETSP0796-20121207/14046_1 /TAXON_ID=73915 /ORGANISM="Pyrodinium bahamense, Strain pbaha01" /LENGTH=108 /DNA_ID=CAMNT_0020733581 /DNA_START=465 /DNA_END=792 /DNA_ORIENTATION=-